MDDKVQLLITKIQNLPSEQSETRRVLKAELEEYVTNFITEILKSNHDQTTPNLLETLDQLYDTPGMPTTIANALAIDVYKLRELLGRKRSLQCESCGKPFEVFERRSRNGYESSYRRLCDDCSELQREQWKIDHETSIADARRRVRVDAQILARYSIEAVTIPELKEAIIKHVHYWINGSQEYYTQRDPHGCMLCDELPVKIWLTKDDFLTDKYQYLISVWEQLQNQYIDRDTDEYSNWTILERPFQLIYRMRSSFYFETTTGIPLLNQPLLILCAKHSQIAEATHFKPYPELYQRG